MKHIVAHRLAPPTPGGINTTTVPQSARESQRNYAIQGFWSGMNFLVGNVFRRMELPNDDPHGKAQAAREQEWRRQTAMPWGSQFMHTPTDAQRLNNPAHASFVKQRQLTVPSSYGQFYAFMRAMSAAFGQLQQ